MWLDRGRPIRQILSRTRIYVRLFLGGLFRGWRSPGQGPQRTPARRAGRRGRQAPACSGGSLDPCLSLGLVLGGLFRGWRVSAPRSDETSRVAHPCDFASCKGGAAFG